MAQSKLSVFVRSYWDYYLELENEFLNTQKYVAFEEHNKNAYSLEFLKLMQAVCSEIDVVSKEIAVAMDSDFKVNSSTNIQKWGYVLQNKLPQILTAEVVFNHSIRVAPWKNWLYERYRDSNHALRYRLKGNAKTPTWWIAYNSVKHQRTQILENGYTNYTKANLMNLIHCFAALYILESEYLATLNGEQEPVDGVSQSRLFQYYYAQFDDLIY